MMMSTKFEQTPLTTRVFSAKIAKSSKDGGKISADVIVLMWWMFSMTHPIERVVSFSAIQCCFQLSYDCKELIKALSTPSALPWWVTAVVIALLWWMFSMAHPIERVASFSAVPCHFQLSYDCKIWYFSQSRGLGSNDNSLSRKLLIALSTLSGLRWHSITSCFQLAEMSLIWCFRWIIV